MKKLLLLLAICVPMLSMAQSKLQPAYLEYIAKYRQSAIDQRKQYKIPASITLAQGLLESAAGKSELATKANNHLGIKCAGDWTGATYHYDDDRRQECFRKYKHAEESYRDHSLFLLRPRYKELFSLKITDYKSWARGLKKCGYATDPQYAEKLIRIIEDYNLSQYDTLDKVEDAGSKQTKAKGNDLPEPLKPATDDKQAGIANKRTTQKVGSANASMPVIEAGTQHTIQKINGKRCVVAREGDTFESIASEFNIRVKSLRKFNDIVNPRYELQEGDKVYLQQKKKYADKRNKVYRVRKNENVWQIAQDKGMKLKSIYQLNGIEEGQNVTVNQELILRK